MLDKNKVEAIKLRLAGVPLQQICHTTSLSAPTVLKAMSQFELHGWQGLQNKKGGRPKCDTYDIGEQVISTLLLCEGCWLDRDLWASRLSEQMQKQISARSAMRYLQDAGLTMPVYGWRQLIVKSSQSKWSHRLRKLQHDRAARLAPTIACCKEVVVNKQRLFVLTVQSERKKVLWQVNRNWPNIGWLRKALLELENDKSCYALMVGVSAASAAGIATELGNMGIKLLIPSPEETKLPWY
ncbi:hypothetical protein DN730_10355 [Marinomonas piezotolerans]|uniref:Uncharacterized protein n=1 Tax=Marinomonas piezotolerans TaxID=2213058 RepID=A0A370U8B2_9GAMM|nr:helix-turn-helix domain-containing protein [Marinomonas piezotolerans]RDL44029.1 hypothetical protein DN730_10355 [Marinomonas piezotolerans]